MGIPADFLIRNARLVATCAGAAPKRGPGQREIAPIPNGAVAAHQGSIVHVGPTDTLESSVTLLDGSTVIDADGCTVVPGFVDPHTHLLYAGDRRSELTQRLSGATYADIAARGGGILATMEATRAASEEQLAEAARLRLDEMLLCGTTTCEIKSGYGLTTESELRQLRAIRRLANSHPMDIAATFLGAHAVPPEYARDRDAYVSLVAGEMIPRVSGEQLAEWCDVFCEKGAFTPEESLRLLEAGIRHGLRPRVHANELGASGGVAVAARVHARSADHLVFADRADAEALSRAGSCAVLLPLAAFYLKLGRFAPARLLIESGVPVAIASDVNPGGGLSPSIPFAIALACFAMDMTLEEALVAVTINAAWSLDRDRLAGSLEPGKLMDAVVIDGDLVELIRVGAGRLRAVIKRGIVVAGSPAPRPARIL